MSSFQMGMTTGYSLLTSTYNLASSQEGHQTELESTTWKKYPIPP